MARFDICSNSWGTVVSVGDFPRNQSDRGGRRIGGERRSSVLTGAMSAAAALGVFYWYGADLAAPLFRLARISFESGSAGPETAPGDVAAVATNALVVVVTPVLLTVFAVTLVALVLQKRPRFSLARPRRWLRRDAPALTLRLLGLALFGLALLTVSSLVIGHHLESISTLPRLRPERSTAGAVQITAAAVRWLLVVTVAVGLADFLFLRSSSRRHEKRRQRSTRRWQNRPR